MSALPAQTVNPPEPAATSCLPAVLDELFQAARSLLNRREPLETVRVLHTEILRLLNETTTGECATRLVLPARYGSPSEAVRWQGDLLAEARAQAPARPPLGRLAQLRERMPPGFPRAALAALFVALTLRYAWAITHAKNWDRQHPEGNWISRFYRNPNFEGFPLVRYDVGVNADFGSGAPVDSMKKDLFSVVWDTCLVVSQELVLPVELTSDDSSKLFVDDGLKLAVDPGPGRGAALVALHPGVQHLRVEFIERHGMAMVRLSGLELEGTDAYTFRRPVFEGTEPKCR